MAQHHIAHDRHSRATQSIVGGLFKQKSCGRGTKEGLVPGPTSKTVRRETSHAERRDGIPGKRFSFFILKQLEGPPSGASNQQATLK